MGFARGPPAAQLCCASKDVGRIPRQDPSLSYSLVESLPGKGSLVEGGKCALSAGWVAYRGGCFVLLLAGS